MFSNNLISNSHIFYGLALFLIPAFTWSRFLKLWSRLEVTLSEKKLFHDRHNCVVMYSQARGVDGWSNKPEKSLITPLIGTPSKASIRIHVYDSIMYFIETAEKSLNVAMMVINITALANALIKAHKRGVKVRVLVDYSYSKKTKSKDLKNAGIELLYYVCPEPSLSSIMHYKYMLKDYSNGRGYVYMGSLNWTSSGVEQNYENTVFTTNRNVVKAINKNFEESWKLVKDLTESNSFVKVKLTGVD